MNIATITLIIKLLDMVHDILCPFFKNEDKLSNADTEKILSKLTELEAKILIMKDKENGKPNTKP